ncbi:CAAX amino protease [Cellulomonas chitinilytica]|uniref:CAAX amino protease n=1 Tax=Cellulomonas chitinilytica TaxID=398759 RepID=A0A919P0X6_9CELL|nr:type II CAAX endopeptidase family protein [Cellulomonas chitinilytica]GIG20635.1 CAAX amino protease [Cellulomonas chitinilytica]
MRLLKQLGTVGGVAVVGRVAVGLVGGSWLLQLLVGAVAAVLTLLAYAWVVRRTEHREPVEVGLAGARSALGRGLGIGVLMFVAVILAITVAGGYRIDGWGSVTVALGVLGATLAAAAAEELVFRGVLFRIIEERAGTFGALLLTAAMFGALHLVNPEATLWGAIAITVEAGLMLGAAFVATRTLWLPIGLHIGWNFAQAGIFGTVVSGSDQSQGLLVGVTSGPVLLSGGAFGPEASLFSVLAGLTLTVVFLRMAARRGRLVPSRRHRAPAEQTVTV